MLNFKHLLSHLKEVELMPKKDWRRRRIKVTIQWSLICQDGLNPRSMHRLQDLLKHVEVQQVPEAMQRLSLYQSFSWLMLLVWSLLHGSGRWHWGYAWDLWRRSSSHLEGGVDRCLPRSFFSLTRDGVSQVFRLQKASPSLLGGGPSSLKLTFVRTWFHVGAKAVLWWATFVLSLASWLVFPAVPMTVTWTLGKVCCPKLLIGFCHWKGMSF